MYRSLIASLVFLSACAIGPDYKAPQLDLPVEFGEKQTTKNQEVVTTNWWESYQDPLLNKLVEQALSDNKDVLQALARINQSRALANVAFGELLPGLGTNVSHVKTKSSGLGFPGGSSSFSFENYTAKVDASWEIDIFGRLRRNLEAKDADFHAQVASLHDTIRILIAEVCNTYFELRGSQARFQIAKDNVNIQQETLKIVNAKFEVGDVSELDQASSLTQLEQTRASISSLEASVKSAIHRLSVLTGNYPKEWEEQLNTVDAIPIYQGDISVGDPASLLRRRPDVKAAERRLASFTAQIGVAIGELFPKINFSGNLSIEGPHFSDITGGGIRGYSFGPSISWRPFDFGRLRSQVKAADARAEEALFAYQQTVLVAIEDVESSLAKFSAEKERRLRLKRSFLASKRAHQLASEQYKEGTLNLISVLQAQETMLQVQRDLSNSEQALAQAQVGIYKALGGRWSL